MQTFNIISGVVLLGVLSCISAQFGPLKYEHVEAKGKSNITAGQQKEMIGKAVSTVASTVAELVDDKGKEKGTKFPLKTAIQKPVPTDTFGVAKIVDHEEGVICSGIHLKPWIILSTAKCLYPRKAENLYVDVIIREKLTGMGVKVSTQVDSIAYHPKFKQGVPHYDLALVLNYASLHWDVDEFKLSRIPYTSSSLLEKEIGTFTYQWRQDREENYIPEAVKGIITTNFSICGEPGSPKNFYCVLDIPGETMLKPNIGDPLYFVVGKMKRCIALYNGRNMDKKNLGGHVYESVIPSLSWIEEFVFEHPIPPFYY